MVEMTRDDLLDELVRMTRARDALANTADRLINERDHYRQVVREYADGRATGRTRAMNALGELAR